MEPNKNWFLYFGLLFIFLGSKIGQAICCRVFCLIYACFYMVLAVMAGIASKLLWALSELLLRLVNFLRAKRDSSMAANAKE